MTTHDSTSIECGCILWSVKVIRQHLVAFLAVTFLKAKQGKHTSFHFLRQPKVEEKSYEDTIELPYNKVEPKLSWTQNLRAS
jgi:hypothetical protein